jgi:cysteine synthase B
MYKTLEDLVGETPLVRLHRLSAAKLEARGNVLLAKLEGNNPDRSRTGRR